MNPRTGIEWILRVGIGGIFLYAGALKAWDPAAFFADVENFRIISSAMAAAVAYYLPWLEILVGVALISGWQYRGGVSLALLLSIAFAILLVSASVRDLDITCGCFGSSDKAVNYPIATARATGMAAGAALLLLLNLPAARKRAT